MDPYRPLRTTTICCPGFRFVSLYVLPDPLCVQNESDGQPEEALLAYQAKKEGGQKKAQMLVKKAPSRVAPSGP